MQVNALHAQLSKNVPNFEGEEFEARLLKNLAAMKGRELPGFLSARLLLSTVSHDLDYWRTDVEETLLDCIDIYTTAASKLANSIFSQVERDIHIYWDWDWVVELLVL